MPGQGCEDCLRGMIGVEIVDVDWIDVIPLLSADHIEWKLVGAFSEYPSVFSAPELLF